MKKGQVLLVDDNTDMELIGERIFTRSGFTYLAARNGQEGLELAKKSMPDVIVLDYMLPDISGTQFLRTMAGDPEYAAIRDIPVVMLTARSDYVEDLDECFRLGLRAFLNKPYGQRELVNIIESIIRYRQVAGNGSPKTAAASAAAAPVPSAINPEWIEDLRMLGNTLARLSRELREHTPQLNDQQHIDVNAIYNTSRRLLELIDKAS
jgi:CheY-like chemotaxis protein